MNQTDYSLLKRMNIQSDAIVVNQCNENSEECFKYNGYSVKWISMSKRGIGLSRNACLMNATADIVLFADDDITYQDGYRESVLEAFERTPIADVICFNIKLVNSNKNIGGHRDNTSCKRLHVYNSMRYGATLLAARRKTLFRERLSFSLLFGGGAEFNSGEDSIFIRDCLSAGMKLYSNTYCLGSVDDSSSSWYSGINDKFFIDRGITYATLFPRIKTLIFLYYAFKMSKLSESYSFSTIYRLFKQGKEIIGEYR